VLLSRTEPDLVDAQYTKNQAWKSDKVKYITVTTTAENTANPLEFN